MISFDDFILKYDGKYLEVAGSANAVNQCVDLANGYIKEVLGLPIIEWTNACDFPSKAGDKYDYIKNTPEGVPLKGDIVVWNCNAGGGYGHIAVCIEATTSKFTSFDQNWPSGTPCHQQGHYYTNVDGWLRKKGATMPTDLDQLQKEYDACRVARDSHWNDLKLAEQKIMELQATISSQATESANLKTELDRLQDQLDLAMAEAAKNNELRDKWHTLYQQSQDNLKVSNQEIQVLKSKLTQTSESAFKTATTTELIKETIRRILGISEKIA